MATPIVLYSGNNFTLYYNVLNYFRTIMTNHPSILEVTQGDISSIDADQFPNYPLGNILITNTVFGTNITTYTVQLTVADKVKNKNNESDGRTNAQIIPYYGVDDVVDIHANTLAIINDLTSYTQRSVQGFEINGDISCEAFSDRFNNGLAGWVATFDLTVHNNKDRCLFELIKPIGFTTYVIENCSTLQQYIAVLDQATFPIGKVFTSIIDPSGSTTYDNLVCYKVLESTIDPNIDFVDLPVLPPGELDTCAECQQWITQGKVWITTPGKWNEQYQTWINI
jgi:hypothetical protein